MQMSQNRQLFSKQTTESVSETFNFGTTNGMMRGVVFYSILDGYVSFGTTGGKGGGLGPGPD